MRYSNQRRPIRLTSSKLKSLIRQTIRESKYDDPIYQSSVTDNMNSEILDYELPQAISSFYTGDENSASAAIQRCLEDLTGLPIKDIHYELLDAVGNKAKARLR